MYISFTHCRTSYLLGYNNVHQYFIYNSRVALIVDAQRQMRKKAFRVYSK
jgi:hypothetical protein